MQTLSVASAEDVAPADNSIKAAVGDLDRFEPEIASMTPNHTASIRRLQRSLALTEQRL